MAKPHPHRPQPKMKWASQGRRQGGDVQYEKESKKRCSNDGQDILLFHHLVVFSELVGPGGWIGWKDVSAKSAYESKIFKNDFETRIGVGLQIKFAKLGPFSSQFLQSQNPVTA